MAQVGRISGPLLEANLLRKGFTNNTSQDDLKFRNTNDDTVLLKIDVTNGRIGVNTDTPVNELQTIGTWKTPDLLTPNNANIANFEIYGDNVDAVSGNIFLDAGERINVTNLETEQFYISDNFITTKTTNTNIDFAPNGTGSLEVQSNLEIFGSLHSTGNITLEGTITFGDALAEDTIDFNADVNDDIIPDITDTYTLGSNTKRWDQLYTSLVNGQTLTTGGVSSGGVRLDLRPGNIFYVAENGSDTYVGDHQIAPLATIQEALSRCDASTTGPVMIYLFPGTYEEACPLIVPDNVQIVGADIRNVIVKPTLATQDQDIFHLSDSSTITNLTIKDFYYNSINNTGYAFRFAANAVITNRSPYIQNVTVITSGSVTSASDPRGFDEGDAGKGAWIDGAELNSASIEASMLFHSATFICPGVDAITMTNGVRVEWLNSFTYFANRGLYALRGLTGRTTYDGSTVNYGAELRSIGSANVYGNYGAVADGADTLMYLIQHNMAYIGVGKFVDNDASRAIYANEIVESNSGIIHFTTTDHLGGFRIGNNFWVDFETGNTTVNIDTLTVNQFNALVINTGADTTVIDGAYIETGNFNISDNLIETYSGDINIASASNKINLQNNTNIAGSLNISGNLSYDGTLNISGDEDTDSLKFNVEFEQNFNPNLNLTYDLGSFEKRWLLAHLNRIEVGNLSLYDNVIETNISNTDLELRANGTGKVYIPNNATFSNSLTVNGTTTINNNIGITDPTFTVTGNINQTGNRTVTENVVVEQNIDIGASAQFEEILIDDNFITTTTSNTDLELRASGTGIVNIAPSVEITNNLSADNIEGQNANVTLNTTADNANIGSIEINDNYIETTGLNEDLILVADRNVVVTGTDVTVIPDLTVQGSTNLQGTSITGTVTHIGDTNQTGNASLAGELSVDNIYIEDNFITTLDNNGNLILSANGTGLVLIPSDNVQISNDLTVSTDTDLQSTTITGSLLHTGSRTQTGNYTQGGELTVDGLYFEDNFVTTIESNADLELRASLELEPGTEFEYEISNPNPFDPTSDGFASGMSMSSSYILVSASLADTVSVTDSGAAFLFDIATGSLVHTFENPSPAAGDNFAGGNGFGVTDAYSIIGASLDDYSGRTNTGRAYLFNNSTGNLELTIDNPTLQSNGYFGNSVDISNSYIIIGSPGQRELRPPFTTVFNSDVGRAYIYDLSGNLLHTIQSPINAQGAVFGQRVKINDNYAVIYGSGRVYVFDTVTGTLLHTLTNPGTGYFSILGISLSGTYVGVAGAGANFGPNANNAYIFDAVTGNLLHTLSLGSVELSADYAIVSSAVDQPIYIHSTTTGELLQTITFTPQQFESGFSAATNGSKVAFGRPGFDTIQGSNGGKISVYTLGVAQGPATISATSNDVQIDNNLTVSGLTTLQGTLINGTLTHIGDRLQTGNYNIVGEIFNGNILIEDNFITTTNTNSDLELRANGTGEVVIDPSDTVTINNNLFVGGTLDYQGFLTINGNVTLQGNTQDGSLTVTENFNVNGTLDISSQAQFEGVRIEDNFVTTALSNANLELRANGTGKILVPTNNVQIDNNLFAANISAADINVSNDLELNNLVVTSGNIEINENYITTKVSNSDLELRAERNVVIRENLISEQDLTGNTAFNINDLNVVGDVAHTGARIQTGNYYFDGNLIVETFSNDRAFQFEDIRIHGNVLETTLSNSNLELHAASSGEIILDGNVDIVQDLSVGTLNVNSITVNNNIDLEVIELSTDIQIEDNFITTTNSNSNLELRTNGSGSVYIAELEVNSSTISSQNSITFVPAENLVIDSTAALQIPKGATTVTGLQGDLRFNTTDNLFEGNSSSRITFGGVYSNDRKTSVLAHPTNNTINLTVNNATVGTITAAGLTIHAIEVEDISISSNIITTNVSNSDLEITTTGTGKTAIDDLSIIENRIQDGGNNLIMQNTGFGKVKFDGTIGIVVPYGTTGERPAGVGQPDPQIGDTRWNTTSEVLETWDGNQYVTAAGVAEAISAEEYNNLLLEYTLIFG